jgi:glycosyltransferase involved in cell wall biosynthesis
MPKKLASPKQTTTTKQIKVLYVCPFAHYPGHFSWAATRETGALKQAGIDVRLLTFCGVIDEDEVMVPQITVLSKNKSRLCVGQLLSFFRKNAVTRWMLMSFETLLTLSTALKLKKRLGIDIIHLRDGEPYIFLPHIMSLPFRNYKWLVSLTASNIYPPTKIKNIKLYIYTMAVKILNNNLWRPFYKVSLKRNTFMFAVQNDMARADYNKYMSGIFNGRVECLPVGVSEATEIISKEEARKHLDLPLDKKILLAFGAAHAGKDIDVVFRTLKNLPGIYFVFAGSQAFGLGDNIDRVARDYINENRMSIRNYYVPEHEKPYYFFATDAIILSYTRQFLSTSSLLWEACRFGTPVIASDNGQLKELMIGFQPGLLFSAQNSDSLREAIIRFINLKPDEISVIKDNCRRFVNHFSHEQWAQKCIRIYDKLLDYCS